MLGIATLAAGCAKARAETVPDGPPLVVPAPPPRVVVPVEEILAAAPPEAEPERPEPRPVPAPPARRPASRASEGDARAEPAPPPAAVVPANPAPEPPRELRAAGAADDAAQRKVRDLLARATRDLNRVDYRLLSAEGKQQYDQAKRFADQADEESRKRNFVYAVTLADKAATLAAQLSQLLGR